MKAYYNENEPKTAAWLRELITNKLIANGDVDERSIHEVQGIDVAGYTQCHFFAGIAGWSRALRLAGWPDDRPVWTGSCPCQPFTSGSGQGVEDPRDLWPVWARLISESKPPIIFGEQVGLAIAHGWLDRLRDDVEASDYSLGSAVLPACCVNADHVRPRLYWAAHSNCERQSEPWIGGKNTIGRQTDAFREADWLVDAVRRKALPFLCSRHDGISARLGEVAIKGFGNAIVPQLAAEFIQAYEEAVMS